MKVGESFAVVMPDDASLQRMLRARLTVARARFLRSRPGWQIISKSRTENGQRVLRFWRVA